MQSKGNSCARPILHAKSHTELVKIWPVVSRINGKTVVRMSHKMVLT